jgi:hypothetical protein
MQRTQTPVVAKSALCRMPALRVIWQDAIWRADTSGTSVRKLETLHP